MGFLNVLFGRKRLPPSQPDRLGAMTSAELTLRTELNMQPAGHAGLAVKTMAASDFGRLRADIQRVLEISGRDLGSVSKLVDDQYGFVWAVISDEDFPDVVAAAQVAASMISEEGFRDQLLCAVFPFTSPEGRALNMVFSFKRGKFYAFAPLPGHKRDTELELRMKALLSAELPMEESLEYWYPLWELPFGQGDS